MHSAFGIVLVVVVAGGIAIALACLLLGRRTWEEFGRSGMLMEREVARGAAPGSAAALAERDDEIRQMLEARNARRVRRGEPPLDVAGELARLTRPAIDPGLREEVRELVLARNYRRLRRGQPALDVEAEVERQISRLGEL